MKLADIVKRVPVVSTVGRQVKRFLLGADGTQAGEYRALKRMLTLDDPTFLVDVGAHDGVSLSNSRPFLQKGWRGILIEPSPEPFLKLSALYGKNDRVRCVNVAASNKKGLGKFYFGSDGTNGFMGTLCTDQNAWFDSSRSETSIEVPVDDLTSILAANGCPADFGLLLVDTEGMDYECLLGLDFTRFRPRVLVTEEYAWNEQKHRGKYQLLERNGYKLAKRIGCNTIWRTVRRT